jgi:hypothetical protein
LKDLPEFLTLPHHIKGYFYHYFLMKIKSKKESKQASAKKSSKKERKVIFKIFEHLQDKGELKNKYSIEGQMDYVEKNMKSCGHSITPEAIFKYYLAFLESNEQEHSRRRSRSKSSSSEDGKRHKKKLKVEEIDEQNGTSSVRKFTIPELTELKKQQMEG